MSALLSNDQLMSLIQNSPVLDEVSASLPQAQQDVLLDLQRRAGDAYAAGEWKGKNGACYSVPQRSNPPTVDEAQQALGQAYLTLETQKAKLKNVMDAMQLTPSARRGNWLSRVVDSITGIWR